MAKGDDTAVNMAASDPNPSAAIRPKPPYFNPAEIGVGYFIFKSNLGSGTYGDVISVEDTRTNLTVAVKKLRSLQSRSHLIRALREIRILSRLQHDDVSTMCDFLSAPLDTTSDLKFIYIVQPIMTTDLAETLKCDSTAAEARKILKAEHKQWIFYQLLRGMKYIHSANLSHRDLKPSNILINEACHIRICDFGMARVMDVNAQGTNHIDPLTQIVQAPCYRAPEIMIASSIYDRSVDVWSIGCILAELLNGKLLFDVKSEVGMIDTVINIMGIPNAEEVQYFAGIGATIPVKFLQGPARASAKPWPELFPNVAADALDLLDRMLEFGPNKRITINDALDHAYVASCRKPHTETECQRAFEQELNIGTLSVDDLQKLLLQWVVRYRNRDPSWDSIELRNRL